MLLVQIHEDYWSGGDSHLQCSGQSVRRVSADGVTVSSLQENTGCRLELADHDKSQHGPDGGERGVRLTRARRSKSSAAMPTRKVQESNVISPPLDPPGNDSDEEVQLVGRSPLAWIQRFEEWHKDMKTQKEKRKAEKKRLRRNQRCESMFPETINGQTDPGILRTRCAVGSSPVPLYSQPRECDDIENFSLGDRRRSNEYKCPRIESVVELKKSSLPRSYSDLFRCPAGISGQRQNQTTNEMTRLADKQELVVPPPHPLKSEVDEVPEKPYVDEARQLARSGSGRPSRGLSDQSTLSRSTNSYVNAASFVMDFPDEMHDEGKSNRYLDEESAKLGKLTTFARGKRPLAHGLILYSPVHCRSSSMDFGAEEAGSYAPPRIRRIVSVPTDENVPQQKCARNLDRTSDCTQAMRERANVLQYMHHKASDASSIAESISRSSVRMSEGSNDTPRVDDQSSNRSGKSTRFRTSSFSFFDKLSSDLENSAHGLDSLVGEAEFATGSAGDRGSISSVATGRSSTVDEPRAMGEAISISS
uniref:Uncharacterized protein n=1 Tax=Hyaloperonospora arabidopsidis (strain Emoy2) TaxID=559515 RepID=M4BEC8_HYAAE